MRVCGIIRKFLYVAVLQAHTHTHPLTISHTHTHPLTISHTHTHTHPLTLSQMEVLGGLKHCLVDVRPSSFDDCIKWARELFQEHFHNTLAQLLYNFPSDHVRPCLSHELFISFQLIFLFHKLFMSCPMALCLMNYSSLVIFSSTDDHLRPAILVRAKEVSKGREL